MSKQLELIISTLLWLVYGLISIKAIPQSDYYLYYAVASFLLIGCLYVFTRLYAAPRLGKDEIFKPLAALLCLMIFSYFVSGYLFAAYVSDLSGNGGPVVRVSLFTKLVLKETSHWIVIPAGLALLHLIDAKKQWVRKTARYVAICIVIGAAGLFAKYALDVNYKGDESIHFMSGDFAALDEIRFLPSLPARK